MFVVLLNMHYRATGQRRLRVMEYVLVLHLTGGYQGNRAKWLSCHFVMTHIHVHHPAGARRVQDRADENELSRGGTTPLACPPFRGQTAVIFFL